MTNYRVRYSYETPGAVLATITGGHRAERRVKESLGIDPQIHSGMAGRGRCCAYLTPSEVEALRAQGVRVAIRRETR
jgi:hypothetical protein